MSHLEVLTPEEGAVLQVAVPPVSSVVCSSEMLTIRRVSSCPIRNTLLSSILLPRLKILADAGKA